MEELNTRFGHKHTYFSPLIFYMILLFSTVCFADGTYRVTNENGVNYLETSNDGSWCITKSDLKFTGQSGNYSTWKDQQGTFLLINKQKIYVDIQGKEKQKMEAEKTNRDQQRQIEARRQQRVKGETQKEQIKAQERQAQADRQAYERQAQADRQAIEENTEALKRANNSKPHTGVTSTGQIIHIIN